MCVSVSPSLVGTTELSLCMCDGTSVFERVAGCFFFFHVVKLSLPSHSFLSQD